ncbi:MAG: hypothetical protein RLZZ487_2115, partial [Pseudomonadota bacterium]
RWARHFQALFADPTGHSRVKAYWEAIGFTPRKQLTEEESQWLDANIWCQASRWHTDELVTRATGEALNAAHFQRHLQSRYL